MGNLRHKVAGGLLATLIALAVSSCGGEQLDVTEADEGRTVEIGLGGVLCVQLDSNPGANLLWVIDHADQTVLQLQNKRLLPTEEQNKFGGHFKREFKFKARRTGQTRLVLVLVSTDEYGDSPSDEYRLTVKVVK